MSSTDQASMKLKKEKTMTDGPETLNAPTRGDDESAADYGSRLKEYGSGVKAAAQAGPRGFRAEVLSALDTLDESVRDLKRHVDHPRVTVYPLEWQGEPLQLTGQDVDKLVIALQISAGLGVVDVTLSNGEALNGLAVGDIENILQMVLNAQGA